MTCTETTCTSEIYR